MQTTKTTALYAPLTEAAQANGIPRTLAFELARTGALETVKIGRRRYVILESLRNLPRQADSSKVELSAV